jgi:hypothetical protein
MNRILSVLALSAISLSTIRAEDSLDPAQIQTFRPYQLTTCLVSGDVIGSMGEGVSLVHQGQEITFCCKSCIKMFAKQPAQFLAAMKAAEQAKQPAETTAPTETTGPQHH